MPEGTLKAAAAAAKKRAAAGGGDVAPAESHHVYVRGRLLPSRKGAARPWLWAGPLRAWANEVERKRDGRPEPGVWVCGTHAAFMLVAGAAATDDDAHARSWQTGDGLLLRFAAEVVHQCREFGDSKRAVKLFNNIMTTAWTRLPADLVARHALKREEVQP